MSISHARRTRNYAEEYRRRKHQGLDRGLSISQIRGHPKPGEAKVSELRARGVIGRPRYTTQSLVTADGVYHQHVELDKNNTRKVALWNSTVGKLMDRRVSRLNKAMAWRDLVSFRGVTVVDTRGNTYLLAADLPTIQQALAQRRGEGGFTFIKHYKTAGREVVP